MIQSNMQPPVSHSLFNTDPTSLRLPQARAAPTPLISGFDDPRDYKWILQAVPLVTYWFTAPKLTHVETRKGAHILNSA